MKQTFTKRIVLFFILVIPAPLLLNLVALSSFSFFATKTHVIQNLYTYSTNFNLELEKILSLQTVFLTRLANTLSLKSFHTPPEDFYNQAYLEMLSLSDSDFSLCLVPLKQGQIKTKNPGDPFIQYLKANPEIKQELSAALGKVLLMKIPSSTKQEEAYLVLAENITSLQTTTNPGLLIAFYPVQSLHDDFFQPQISNKEHICVLDTNGKVLFTSFPPFASLSFSANIDSLPKMNPTTSSIPLKRPSKGLRSSHLFFVTIQGTKYIGLIQDRLPIEGTFTISLYPLTSFICEALVQPIHVILFYIIAFILLKWLLSQTVKRLNQPMQELINCMEAVWRGNHHVRYESQPHGYEINELGNIFNCTLILLLNLQEKAEIEYVSGTKLKKELSILSSLQTDLLTPNNTQNTNPTMTTVLFHTHLKTGLFHAIKTSDHQQIVTGVIGSAGDVGLPSYLYALSARSLFLAFANLYSTIEHISQATNTAFQNTTEGDLAQVSMLFFQYSRNNQQLKIFHSGQDIPQIFLKRKNTFQQLALNEFLIIEEQDLLIFVIGNPLLAEALNQLHIPELLQDSLSPMSDHFVPYLTDMIKTQKQAFDHGMISFLSFP